MTLPQNSLSPALCTSHIGFNVNIDGKPVDDPTLTFFELDGQFAIKYTPSASPESVKKVYDVTI